MYTFSSVFIRMPPSALKRARHCYTALFSAYWHEARTVKRRRKRERNSLTAKQSNHMMNRYDVSLVEAAVTWQPERSLIGWRSICHGLRQRHCAYFIATHIQAKATSGRTQDKKTMGVCTLAKLVKEERKRRREVNKKQTEKDKNRERKMKERERDKPAGLFSSQKVKIWLEGPCSESRERNREREINKGRKRKKSRDREQVYVPQRLVPSVYYNLLKGISLSIYRSIC